VVYKGVRLDCGYHMDLVVEDSVVVELKAVDQLLPVHHAQLLTYLKLSGHKVGLLMNFNAVALRDGLIDLCVTNATGRGTARRARKLVRRREFGHAMACPYGSHS